MNQQRMRRFRAAKDAADKRAAEEEEIRKTSEVAEDVIKQRHAVAFDTNAITPGLSLAP